MTSYEYYASAALTSSRCEPLAECLTLNKSNFIRASTPGATFLTYRKALQEVVNGQLAAWGAEGEKDLQRRRRIRPVERDLENILVEAEKPSGQRKRRR